MMAEIQDCLKFSVLINLTALYGLSFAISMLGPGVILAGIPLGLS